MSESSSHAVAVWRIAAQPGGRHQPLRILPPSGQLSAIVRRQPILGLVEAAKIRSQIEEGMTGTGGWCLYNKGKVEPLALRNAVTGELEGGMACMGHKRTSREVYNQPIRHPHLVQSWLIVISDASDQDRPIGQQAV